jgi:hypothetical protein
VCTPKGAIGPRPLVIFLHGRHECCYGDDPGEVDKPWPCPKAMKPVPSFRGYDAPATALASNGHQVVSISANAVNAYDGGVYDSGAQARAELTPALTTAPVRRTAPSTVSSSPAGPPAN